MHSPASKPHQNNSQQVSNEFPQKQGVFEDAVQFVDNREGALTQRKLQKAAQNPNGPDALRAIQLRSIADAQPTQLFQPSNAGSQYAPIQRKLKFTGGGGLITRALDIINAALLVKQANVDGEGYMALTDTDYNGPQTPAQVALATRLATIIGDGQDTSIAVGAAEKSVLIGSFNLEKIDIADMEAFGTGEGVSAVSTLIHEIVEQYHKQVKGEQMQEAHFGGGVAAEVEVSGATRGADVRESWTVTDGFLNAVLRIPYTYPNGKVLSVKMTVVNSNVTNVERTIIKQPYEVTMTNGSGQKLETTKSYIVRKKADQEVVSQGTVTSGGNVIAGPNCEINISTIMNDSTWIDVRTDARQILMGGYGVDFSIA